MEYRGYKTRTPDNRNWEEIYKAILKDITRVVEDSSKGADRKVSQIAELLVSNDFMENSGYY